MDSREPGWKRLHLAYAADVKLADRLLHCLADVELPSFWDPRPLFPQLAYMEESELLLLTWSTNAHSTLPLYLTLSKRAEDPQMWHVSALASDELTRPLAQE